MEKLSHGLHGLNKKIPEMILKRDLLSFSLQAFSLFACVFSAILWAVFGFDSTIDGTARILQGKAVADIGNGTHWSTVLNFFLIVFLISNYLSNKEIKGFHNFLISVFTPIVGMMTFEFVWVFLNDVFHQLPVEGYFANTLFGLGNIDIGMLIFGMILIPMSMFYFAFRISNKINVAPKASLNIAWLAFATSAILILTFSIIYGTPALLIRNTFALFFVAFADAVLVDATKNWGVKGMVGKYKINHRLALAGIVGVLSAFAFVSWITLPGVAAVKGSVMFPQTVYAFYSENSAPELLYVPNIMVHMANLVTKALVSAAVALAIIPKIELRNALLNPSNKVGNEVLEK